MNDTNPRQPGLLFYRETLEMLLAVPAELAGRCLQNVFRLFLNGEALPETQDLAEKILLAQLVRDVERDRRRYAANVEQRRSAANARWHGDEGGDIQ